MWADLAEFVKANSTETLLISIIGTALVWMYKQFKGMIDREQDDKLKTAQLKQGLFTKLELSIASVLHLNKEESKQRMYALLGECGPYLTNTQRSVIRDYYKTFDTGLLHSLQALTVNEVDKLNRQLEKIIENKESGEWLNYLQRLNAPFGPILLFIGITLYILYFVTLMRQGATLWIQINILLLGFTIMLAALMTFSWIFFLIKSQVGKQGVKRWVAIALIIVSPAIMFVFNRVDLSMIALAIQVSMMVFLSFSKRPSEIIRP